MSNGGAKLVDLWFVNERDNRSSHPLHIIPWMCILAFFVVGVVAAGSWRRQKYVYLFLLCSSIVCIVFFALPRYQTMMKIATIPLAAHGLEATWRFLKSRFSGSPPAS
jgi:hypothetical protein